MDLQVVHVRINDAATGQPTPVRIRCVDAAGRYRAPLGRLEHLPTDERSRRSLACTGGNVELDGRMYAYIDGTCEILLPAGSIDIEVSKGFEYAPLHHAWDRKPGQVSLRLQIERKFNLAAEGWYAGDICAHFLSLQAAWLEGAAEGLSVVNLLAAAWEEDSGGTDISVCAPAAQAGMPVPRYFSNLLDFTGQQEPPKKDGTLVAVNTLNRGGPLGDFLLLNCHRPVFPLRLGAEGFEQYTPADWIGQCHRKGGLVASTRCPGEQWPIDALAWTPDMDFVHDLMPRWYAALNRGEARNVALVGGSGKTDDRRALGAVRTYALIPPADASGDMFNYHHWIGALRERKTFATRGPMLELTVDEATVRARARSLIPFDRLELVCGGEVIHECPAVHGESCTLELPCTGNKTWLAARCWRAGELMAHTSPVWLADTGSATRR